MSGQRIAPGVTEPAGRVLAPARGGHTEEPAASVDGEVVDAGVPAGLIDGGGDTLLIPAAHHGHPATVAALPVRGADPTRGFSGLPATSALPDGPG